MFLPFTQPKQTGEMNFAQEVLLLNSSWGELHLVVAFLWQTGLLSGFSVIWFVFEISESDTDSKKCDIHLSIGKPVVSIIHKILLFSVPVLPIK